MSLLQRPRQSSLTLIVQRRRALPVYGKMKMNGLQVICYADCGVSDPQQSWKKIPDPILHIELRRWADLVLIAPCSANTLAKLAGGLCDNLATNVLRALPPISPQQRSPTPSSDILADVNRSVQVWVFPAMNTLMYEHPLTAVHLKTVTEILKYRVEGPIGAF